MNTIFRILEQVKETHEHLKKDPVSAKAA